MKACNGNLLLLLLSRLENLERAQQALVYAHHRTSVVELATVVGCREKGDKLALAEELVSVLDDLVSTANEVHVVLLEEARDNVGSESERDTAIVLAPACDVLIRVRPKQIAEKTAVGDLKLCQSEAFQAIRNSRTYVSGAHDTSDLLHGVEVGAQATVHGEDLLVDDGGDGQAVEAVGKSLPQLDVVTSLALVVETVDTVDGGTLVVAAQDEEVFGVLDLVCQQKADSLEGLLATVDVVTEEEVVCLGWESTVLEEAEKIVVLAVNVTANLNCRSINRRIESHASESLTLIGASSSRRMGCEMKISRLLVQR